MLKKNSMRKLTKKYNFLKWQKCKQQCFKFRIIWMIRLKTMPGHGALMWHSVDSLFSSYTRFLWYTRASLQCELSVWDTWAFFLSAFCSKCYRKSEEKLFCNRYVNLCSFCSPKKHTQNEMWLTISFTTNSFFSLPPLPPPNFTLN